jgi:hypothetical protein
MGDEPAAWTPSKISTPAMSSSAMTIHPRSMTNYGQTSIDRMIASTEHDWIASGKTVKQLKFTAAAPGTQRMYG